MPKASPYSPKEEQALMNKILSPEIADSPFNYVMFAFPWGQEGTPLERFKGPRNWQIDELLAIGDHIKSNRQRIFNNLEPVMYNSSTVSGRGIGKSALVAWLNMWSRSCLLGSTAITTANTETQLVTRTWAELGKWHTLAINGHWFEKTAMSLKPEGWFGNLVKKDLKIDTGYYYGQAQIWSEENPDAFAGVHNPLGMLLVYDEASGIPAPIWKVSEGFFTEPELHRYWLVFSNGRRNTGAFFETHHRDRDFWKRRQIDSRTVEGTDKTVYEKIIKQYGDDSDEARVEVYGKFPRVGDNQFIGRYILDEAIAREDIDDEGQALVMGVDVARFGGDRSVIRLRQGRNARFPSWRYKGMTTTELARRVAEVADRYDVDAIFVDGNGVGGGVVDTLREMGYRVIEVQAGGKADEPVRYFNRRTELWGKGRDWLARAAIPNEEDLVTDAVGPEYKITPSGALQLESKEDMKKRGLASPDEIEALFLTMDRPIAARSSRSRSGRKTRVAAGVDYDLFS